MDARELVTRYFDIIETGELDGLDEILHPDVYDHVGDQAGIQWWKDILRRVTAGGTGDERTSIEHLLVDGDLVVAHVVITGTQTVGFLPQIGPVTPSGLPFVWRQFHQFRVQDDLLVEHWAVRDDLGRAKQVGAL